MIDRDWMSFSALDALPAFRHRFTLRYSEIDVKAEREVVVSRLWAWHHEHVKALGIDAPVLRTAQQVHGCTVATVSHDSSNEPVPAADGLVSDAENLVIGIYVADCCAVFLADPVTGSFGIVHSGKKGSEGGIVVEAIKQMQRTYGSRSENIVVQLSPCIRPPSYEIDFAATIRENALAAGILPRNLHDSGICTSSDLSRFYSYRMEKGQTGRMLALLARNRSIRS